MRDIDSAARNRALEAWPRWRHRVSRAAATVTLTLQSQSDAQVSSVQEKLSIVFAFCYEYNREGYIE
jgi:hypothetical protein